MKTPVTQEKTRGRGSRHDRGDVAVRLTPTEIKAIRGAHARGASTHALAERYGVTRATIRWHLTDDHPRYGEALRHDDLPQWMAAAACKGVDPNLFFPPAGERPTQEARETCARCPVTAECLEYALTTCQQYGLWGGTTPMERREMRRAAR